MRPPRLTYVTSSGACRESVDAIAAEAVRGGVDAVQVREHALPDRAHLELLARIKRAVRGSGALVLANDRVDLALAAGADGIHLKSDGLDPGRVRAIAEARRPDGPGRFVVGIAAHDGAELARRALDPAVDYVSLGPLAPSPGKTPLGLEGLRTELERARRTVGGPLPCAWIALGGVTPDHVPELARCAVSGEAWGVAAIRCFQSDRSATREVARAFRIALDSCRPSPEGRSRGQHRPGRPPGEAVRPEDRQA